MIPIHQAVSSGSGPASLATEDHAHGWLGIAATAPLGLMILRAVWRSGLRGWLRSLGEALGSSHDHDHGHAHVPSR